MTESTIVKFPQPAEDDLAPEQRMVVVARLAERVANLMQTDRQPMAIGDLLDCIESGSEGEIGAMMLIGADRPKMEQFCRNVQVTVARIGAILAGTGVNFEGRR
ncbi:hypothetical protein [Bradyrhizobium stylosanthis]|uniref:hypothetical protein n=1 Tax=Bradyrhizobium stylosanthis TaxID=1803665 RepID=UPI00119D2375|nr:hypothetical protein [Bradyrhizobium stylosanthis]